MKSNLSSSSKARTMCPSAGTVLAMRITDAVKRSTLAFWDAYLKDDGAAKASLTSGSVFAALKGKATLLAK